jgi:hypothetical protein
MTNAETTTPQQQVDKLAAFIRTSLKNLPKPNLENTEALGQAISEREALAAELRQALTQIKELGWGDLAPEAQQELQTEFDTFIRKSRNLTYLHETKQEAEELWANGERTSGDIAINYFGDAQTELEAALNSDQHDWDKQESRFLNVLIEEARKKYDEIRRRHYIPTTKLEGQVVETILEFAVRVTMNPDEKVTYFNGTGVDAVPVPMSVSEALEMARERLLVFWNYKSEEYLEQARKKLREHLPREAEAILNKTDTLPGRGDDRVQRDFPPNVEVAIDNLRQEIDGELQLLKQTESNIANARATDWGDILKQFAFYQKAQETYPYIEAELRKLHEEIVQQADKALAKLLTEVGDALKNENWNIAQSRLERAQKLLETIESGHLRSNHEDNYQRLQAIFDSVEAWTLPPGQQPQGEKARQLLTQLQQHYQDDYWPHWGKLQTRLNELQARSNIEGWLKQVEDACKSTTTIWDLEALLVEGEEFEQNPPIGLSANNKRQLAEAIKRLQAWRGFAQARDELRKLHRVQFDAQNGLDDSLQLPDLELVEVSIKQAHAYPKDNQLIRLIKEQKLEVELKTIRANDAAVEKTIENVQQLLNRLSSPSLEEWRQTYKVIDDALKKGSSHAQALWDERERVRGRYAEDLYEEVKRQLGTVRGGYYAHLNIGALRPLVTEYEELVRSRPLPSLPDKLDDLTVSALEIAVAHQYETDTRKGVLDNWDNVITAWEKARDLPQTQSDGSLRDYCHQRARHAYKEKQWREVGRLAKEDWKTGENMLRLLTDDRTLANNWEVWLHHAEYGLETVRRQLATGQPELAELKNLKSYLDRARRSFNRARSEGEGKAIADERLALYQTITNQLQTLDEWETVLHVQESVATIFEIAELTNHLCAEALAKYDDAGKQLTLPEAKKSLSAFWEGQLVSARKRLEELYEEAENVFIRLDILLALLTLFPKDESVESRLELLVRDGALNKIQQDVKASVFDDSAVRFVSRYLQTHDNRPPANKDIAQLQLDEIETLLQELYNLKAALKLKQLAKLKIDDAILSDAEDELKQWRSQLEEFQRGLNSASRLGQAGLRDPRQFRSAFYALRQNKQFPETFNALFHSSGNPGPSQTGIARIPENFVNNRHPSYEWRRLEIETSYQTWEKQLRFKLEVETLFADEQEIIALIERRKQGQKLSDNEIKQAQGLPKLLSEMQRKLAEMREDAPNDPTRLQSDLKYQAVDEDNNHYISLVDIEKVIGRKLDEREALIRWLNQYHIGDTSLSVVRFRIVDWAEERKKLAQQRDKDRRNFKAVKETCQQILTGDDQGMYQTKLWSLKSGWQALSETAMMAYLEKQTNKRAVTGSDELRLYAVSELINWQRQEKEKTLQEAIQDCEQFMDNVQWRIREINARWSAFISAQQMFMGVRRGLFTRKPWQEMLEYNAYVQKAQDFCAICPYDSSFRQAIDEVTRKTGLRFECIPPNK